MTTEITHQCENDPMCIEDGYCWYEGSDAQKRDQARLDAEDYGE